MRPNCPHCGSAMTLAKVKARKDAGANFKTYCCEPCGCLYCVAAVSYDVAKRVMMLDLEASAQFGARH